MRQSTKEAVDTYINGNIGDFIAWLKKCRKVDVLDAIEYYSGTHGKRREFINIMRHMLEADSKSRIKWKNVK